jgi:D-glycero-D-manno-heptose 1,7-bisphosphate phosphatase
VQDVSSEARARRAVFLDRDGVVVRALVSDGLPRSASTLEALEILPDVEDACLALKEAGFALVVVTNQPEIARGTLDPETVVRQNDALKDALPLDEVVVCPHDDADGCDCRKPKPGMLLDAASRLGIDLAASFMVGDRWRDVEAGRAAGCRVVFVDHGYDESLDAEPDAVVSSLGDASRWVLSLL